MAPKLKVAIFDLTGCEGCQFHLMSLNEYLMDFFQEYDIVNWRLMSDTEKKSVDFDLAVIEGAVTTNEQIKLLQEVRASASVVVGIGACAVTGNFFRQLTPEQRQKLAPQIYDKNYQLKAKFLEPVEKFIHLDHKIPGCPPDIDAMRRLFKELKNQTPNSAKKEVVLPDYTAKIEGHGTLKVDFSNHQTSFTVEESERLVEGLVEGKPFNQAPFLTSRICGICPIAHNLASWTAIENAMGLQPSANTISLRQILSCGQIIKSHVLHLFFLVLPDFAGVKGGVELASQYPAEFHLMLNIKRVADQLLQLVGGSDAFPTNTALAGFNQIPSIDKLSAINEEVEQILDEAQDLIMLFASLTYPELSVTTKMATTTPTGKMYPLYPGAFNQAVKEIVVSGSTAKLAVLPDGTVIKSGALARLSAYSDRLNSKAAAMFRKTSFNHSNPYHNNLAQAIEILHFLEEVLRLSHGLINHSLEDAKTKPPVLTDRIMEGISSIEAPRGILIHRVKLDQSGQIQQYNIIPPTQINLASLQTEAQKLVEYTKTKNHEQTKKEIEALIRAFDPCITCAVH